MKLKEVFDQLSSSEFSQLSIGGQEAGKINDENQAAVTQFINLGLSALYTRFNLKEKTFILELQPDKKVYVLSSDYAESNLKSNQNIRYIQDTSDAPFTDDMLKIISVVTDTGIYYRINDGTRFAIKTPNMRTLEMPKNIPTELKSDTLEVTYKANHPKLNPDDPRFDPERLELELPYSHLSALLYFVASRVNNPIGMQNEFHAGNSYYAKYEAACLELVSTGQYVDDLNDRDVIKRGGWV